MRGSPTVLVVGGGATGASIARDLSMRGVDAMLVERDGLASGTSGRSHGLLHSGARYAESDPSGAEECIEESNVLREIAGDCVRDTGGLFVRLADDDPAAEIRADAPLEALSVSGGRITEARLGGAVDATVEPEYVVNAAGAWAGLVAAMAGVDVGMAPSGGHGFRRY